MQRSETIIKNYCAWTMSEHFQDCINIHECPITKRIWMLMMLFFPSGNANKILGCIVYRYIIVFTSFCFDQASVSSLFKQSRPTASAKVKRRNKSS